MNLKKIGKVFTNKSVGTGPSSYEKRIYRAAVSQRLRNTGPNHGVEWWWRHRIVRHRIFLKISTPRLKKLWHCCGGLMNVLVKVMCSAYFTFYCSQRHIVFSFSSRTLHSKTAS